MAYGADWVTGVAVRIAVGIRDALNVERTQRGVPERAKMRRVVAKGLGLCRERVDVLAGISKVHNDRAKSSVI